MTQSDRGLITEIRSLIRDERFITRKLLEKIALVSQRRLYADLGYSSLLSWMMEDLRYSKSAAFRRISAAKLIHDMPEAKAMIEEGHLNVTTLTQLKSAIYQTEKETKAQISLARKEELIAKIKDKSSDDTDRIIAIEFPDLKRPPPETLRAVGPDNTELTIVLNKEQIEILKRVKEVISHSHFNASWTELIEVMGRFYLRHKDPLQRKTRENSKKRLKIGSGEEPNWELDQTIRVAQDLTLHESNICSPVRGEQSGNLGADLNLREDMEERRNGKDGKQKDLDLDSELNKLELQISLSPPTTAASQLRRTAYHRVGRISCSKKKPLPSKIRNLVFQRDGTRCTFVSPETGHTCESRDLIEVDHILAKARGGIDHPENLRPYCRAHNRLAWKMQS
jgi:hypothetical protein